MRTILACALLSVGLGGCAQMKQNMVDYDNRECAGMGLQYGSTAFAQCRIILDQRRQQAFREGMDDIARGLSRRPSTDVYIYSR